MYSIVYCTHQTQINYVQVMHLIECPIATYCIHVHTYIGPSLAQLRAKLSLLNLRFCLLLQAFKRSKLVLHVSLELEPNVSVANIHSDAREPGDEG